MKKYMMMLVILTIINVILMKAFGGTNETATSYTRMYNGYGGYGNPIIKETKWVHADNGNWVEEDHQYEMFGIGTM